MESCQYEPVKTELGANNVNEQGYSSTKLFMRQLLIASTVWALFFQSGLCMGAPTVYIPQLRKEANSTDAVSEEMTSWLSSLTSIVGIPWTLVMPFFADGFGRKKTYIFANIICFISIAYLYFSKTTTDLLIGSIIGGVGSGVYMILTLLILSEYSSTKNRGLFFNMLTGCLFWGMFISNTIGTYFHWRYIYALAAVISIFILCVSICLLSESPYWLAAQQRFDECAEVYYYLNGVNEDSKKELSILTNTYKENKNKREREDWKQFLVMIVTSKTYYKPVLLGALLHVQFNSTGKFVCSIYAVDVIKKVTESEQAAYAGMLLLDVFTIMSTYIGTYISKICNRRPQLFITTAIAVICLCILSLYMYLIKLSVLQENHYVSIIVLIVYSSSLSCGPMILGVCLCGELIPLCHRSTFLLILSVIGLTTSGIFLKFAPFIFRVFQMHGAFLYYGILTTISSSILYKYLPETKDKATHEIEISLIK